MPKVFSKNPKRTLFLALLIASAPSFAAYSDDPDCSAVSNSAKAGASQIGTQVDQSAVNTGKAIARTKSCIDQLLEQANRAVPNFGGGLLDSIYQFANDLMLQQACSLISNTQSQLTNATNSVTPTIPTFTNLSTTPAPTIPGISNAGGSVWQRISNLF